MHSNHSAPPATMTAAGCRAAGWLRGTIAVALLLTTGCEPSVRPADLGHVIYDQAELPGAGEPYPLPQLERDPGEIIRGEKPVDKTPAKQPADAASPAR
ncbi:MAG: hypothetical protein HYX69_17975 [Planctomycetia bacterium]|nr:hypothetical protein [Planctomycetia bacterium]